MRSNTDKAYLLTYLSTLVATISAIVVSSIITYVMFRHSLPTNADIEKYQEAAIAISLITVIFAFIVFSLVFDIVAISLVIILLKRVLKDFPVRRTATIVWTSVFIFITPLVLIICLSTSSNILLTLIWLQLAPFIARLLATMHST